MPQMDKGGLLLRSDSSKLKFNNIFKKKRKTTAVTAVDSNTPKSAETAVFHFDDTNHLSNLSESETPHDISKKGIDSPDNKVLSRDSSLTLPFSSDVDEPSHHNISPTDPTLRTHNPIVIPQEEGEEESNERWKSTKAAVEELIPTFLDMRRRLITDLNINPELYQKKIDAFCESRDEIQADDPLSSSPMMTNGNGTNSRDGGTQDDTYFNSQSHTIDISHSSKERAERVKTALEIYFGSIERYCSVVHYDELGNGTEIPKYEGVEGVYNPLQIIRNRRIRKKNRERFQELAFNVVPLPSQVFSKYSRQRNIWQVNLRELRNDITWRESHWNELRMAKGKLWFPKPDTHLKPYVRPLTDAADRDNLNKDDNGDVGLESPQRLHEQLFADFDSESVYAKYEDDEQYAGSPQGNNNGNTNNSRNEGGGNNSLKSLENGQLPKTSHSSLSLLRSEQYVPRTSISSTNIPFKKSISSSSVSKFKRISRSPARLLNSLKSSDSLPLHKTDGDYLGSLTGGGRPAASSTPHNSSTDDESYTRSSSLVLPGNEEHPAIEVDEVHSIVYDDSGVLGSRRPSQVNLESAISKINFDRRARSRSRHSSNEYDGSDSEAVAIGTGISVNNGDASTNGGTDNIAYNKLDTSSVAVDVVSSEEDNDEVELLEHVKLLKQLEGEVIVGGLTISAHEKNIEAIISRSDELIQNEANIFYKKIEEADLLTKEIQSKFNEFDKIIEQNLEVNNVQESKIDELLGFSDRTIGEINTSVALQIRNLSEQLDKSSSKSMRSGTFSEDFLTTTFYNFLENLIVLCLWVVWIIVEILRSFKLCFRFVYVILRWIFF